MALYIDDITVEEDTLLRVSGSTTIDVSASTVEGVGGAVTPLSGTTTVTPSAAAVSGAGGESVVTPKLIPKKATAEGGGEEISTDVIGKIDQVTVLIEGERINTYTNIDVQTRLNEVDTFSFNAFIADDRDRALINEGNIVKIIEDYNDLLFKGELTEVEYKSDFRAKCEGDGMSTKLLNRKTERETFTTTAGDAIVKDIVPSSVMDRGNVESAPAVSIRFDHDNLARGVAGVANATGYDWYIDQNAADDFDTDFLNFVSDAGRDTSQATLEIGEDLRNLERNKDEGFVANDITLLGRGDGINQLEARVFAASDKFIDIPERIPENFTGSITFDNSINDKFDFGDILLMRVGTEVMEMEVDGTSSTLASSLPVPDPSRTEQEFELFVKDSPMFFDEFAVELRDAGTHELRVISDGQTIAKTTVTNSLPGVRSFTFSRSDYSRLLKEEVVVIDVDGLYTPADSSSQNIDNQFFSSNPDPDTRVPADAGGANISATAFDINQLNILDRGLPSFKDPSPLTGDFTDQIEHYKGVRAWRIENKTKGIGRFTPENRGTAETGSSIDTRGVKQQRDTDKTIVDISSLEKAADLELKNRFEDVFRVQADLSDPEQGNDFNLGDTVTVQDLTAMDVDNKFQVVGKDIRRASSEEGTKLHLANRPRRLTERLSEIESDKDTLNAHMQGATNFNGETFEDNCNQDFPLSNKVLVPTDVVAVNKFEVSFTRESFRGYVKDEGHKHDIDIGTQTAKSSETGEYNNMAQLIPVENSTESTPSVNADVVSSPTGTDAGVNVTANIFNQSSSSETYDFEIVNTSTSTTLDTKTNETINSNKGETFNFSYGSDKVSSGDNIELNITSGDVVTQASPADASYIELDVSSKSTHEHNVEIGTQTSKSAGNPTFGIFEPSTENDVDVDLVVDGDTVKTFSNVSVGDEINPVDVRNQLSEPLAGEYHEIRLEPTGRCRLSADISQKVFIESTL